MTRTTFLTPTLLLVLLLGAIPATAQNGDTALPLWEVSDGERSLYLMGSVHMLRPEVYPLHDALYEAFDQAEIVAFELDFGLMAEAGPYMMRRGMYDDGRTLGQVLPADVHAELVQRIEQLGLPMAAIEPMKPWMAAMTLTALLAQQQGFDAAAGIDSHFYQRALEADMEVVGLETITAQVDVFEGLTTEQQVAFLASTLEQFDEAVAMLDRMTGYWLEGRTDALADIMLSSMEDQPALMERILFERNRNWIAPLEGMLAAPQPAIAIVGVGHLAGPENVLDLLRERGYDVRQVTVAEVTLAE